MLNFFKLALPILVTICLTTAIPFSEPAGRTALVSGNINATTSVDIPQHQGIDPRFGGSVIVQGAQILDTDSGLMAMTEMMYRLSLKHFNGMMPSEAWESGTSEPVSFQVRVLPGRELIPTKFVVWGAQLLGQHILSHRQVRNVVWALTWERIPVGYIDITRRPALLSPAGSKGGDNPVTSTDVGSRPETQLRAAAVPGNKDDDVTIRLPVLDDRLDVRYRMVRNRPMTKWELFANIFGILGFASSFPPSERSSETWTYTSVLFPNTHFQYLPVTEVEYQWRALAAYLTAGHILQQQLFFTMAISIYVGGEVVCRGSLYRGNNPPQAIDLAD
ncbi:MAG: hypothetical protein LQ337_007450 [Flavoplaca oasis]|nr:MAG: hypothetical protein LQ337_007450 [Flavoplaca oasis]